MRVSSLETAVRKILESSFGISPDVVPWSRPGSAEYGDIATPIALQVAKRVKKKPIDIAQEIAASLGKHPLVERCEVAAPGYVNVWLGFAAHRERLADTRSSCTPAALREEPPVIIDYSGPNIAKPLGIHHILSTVIGQVIVNLYRHTGWNVIGWSYPGDWGTQFGKLAVAFERWGSGKPASEYTVDELLALYVRFHKEAEGNPALEEEGRAAFAKLEKGDPALRAFWADVVKVSRAALGALYERLHVYLDRETAESFYEDKMAPILQEGMAKGVFTEGEGGSLIVEFPPAEDLPPFLLRKSDGSTLYATRDLAMIRYRIDTCHPSAISYVVDVAQSLHFRQLFATARLLGWKLPELQHTVFGRMRFADAAMSTRKGTVLKLESVLDEAVRRAGQVIKDHGEEIQTDDPAALAEMMGVGAVAYGILSQNRRMDMVFDWAKVLSFDGNSAPYLQYTHARARSVLRRAGAGYVPVPESGVEVYSPHERALVNSLSQFPAVLEQARAEQMPHVLAHFLFSLCQDFNAFYNAEPILKAPEREKALRLSLTSLTADVLRCGAELLTLRVPDRM